MFKAHLAIALQKKHVVMLDAKVILQKHKFLADTVQQKHCHAQ